MHLKIAKCIYKYAAHLTNEEMSFNLSASPKEVMQDTLKVSTESKYHPLTGLLENDHAIRFGSNTIGPLRLWLNVSFSTNLYILLPTVRYFIYDI